GGGGEARFGGSANGITGNLMVPFMLYPCRADEPWSPFREHEGQEFVFVHRGSAELQTPSDTVRLDVGDSAYFAGTLPHRQRHPSDRSNHTRQRWHRHRTAHRRGQHALLRGHRCQQRHGPPPRATLSRGSPTSAART
ncbi:cupin domain-containing protein, partial [Lacticaseibacillus rhamnosus]